LVSIWSRLSLIKMKYKKKAYRKKTTKKAYRKKGKKGRFPSAKTSPLMGGFVYSK